MAGGIDSEGHKYHFVVLGFPVHVGWQFFLWPVLVGLNARTPIQLVEWVAVVFSAVMIHEIGHALAFRRYGSPARIELWGMGGLTHGRKPHSRTQDLLISLAGPVPPLVFVGIPAYLAYRNGVFEGDPFWHQTLLDIWYANLFWSIINLIPILPMDGGRVVDIWYGRRVARITSIVTALVAGVVLIGYWGNTTLGILALIMAGVNIYVYTKEKPLNLDGASGYMEAPGGMRFDGSPRWGDDPPARRTRPKGKLGIPKRQPKLRVVPTGPDPKEPDAWAALAGGDVEKADKVVKKLKIPASPVLQGAILASRGSSGAAVAAYATGILDAHPVPSVADNILAGSGLAGQVAEWIAHSDQFDRSVLLAELDARMVAGGHDAAAAEVGEVRAAATSGTEVGRRWYEAACRWGQAGVPDRALAALRRSAAEGFPSADMVRLEPGFAALQDDPELVQLLATLR